MNKIFYTLFLIFSFASSQNNTWWIFFNDKDCNPSINLSDRSIDRRLQQNIEFDFYDLSICDEYVDSLKIENIIIRNYSRWLNAVSVQVDSQNILEKISNFSFVKMIKPVQKMIKKENVDLFAPSSLSIPINNRIGVSLPYGDSFNQIDMLGGVDLHNAGFLGNNMIIAVFDAGFNDVLTLPIFENLLNNNQIQDTYDFVDNDNDVFNGSSHGTMVLSTMGGYMEDSLIGTAPEATYMLFRTEDSDSETLIEEDNWAAAAEYADSAGADIINSSLGYTILYDDTLNNHSYVDMDGNSTIITNAADLAASRGILVVNSAGNSGNNDWYYIGAPADGDSVLAVGAVNAIGDVASFSSRGPSYDGRIKPNVCAQGVFSVVADLDSTIRVANGTSFSAPIISGLSACLWQANPTLTNMEILEMIEESAHLFSNPNDSLGYGIPNFYQAYLNNLDVNSKTQNDFLIYPNPYSDMFFIQNDQGGNVEISIFNIMGSLVFSESIHKDQNELIVYELSDIPQGIYLVKINNSLKFQTLIKLNE